MMSSTKPETT